MVHHTKTLCIMVVVVNLKYTFIILKKEQDSERYSSVLGLKQVA
jgi:hypothetical protein